MRLSFSREPLPPQVRALEPWRDGRQLATLIEVAFSRDEIGVGGARMIELLRSYGQYEPMMFGMGTSYVWVEGGRLVGNASIQRNPTRLDTWIIGNVATDPAHRRKGVARAVIEACVRHARARGARQIALLVDRDNASARRLYESLSFDEFGMTTYYLRDAVRDVPVTHAHGDLQTRPARWSDHRAVWELTRGNIPEEYTYAEPFDASLYQLGLFWSLRNFFGGGRESWLVLEDRERGGLLGAVRTHVGRDEAHHHLELMLGAHGNVMEGEALMQSALHAMSVRAPTLMPIAAAQSHTNMAAMESLERAGFQPRRVLLHMKRCYW
jgi:GNAT superfamily N-acetyltransferase